MSKEEGRDEQWHMRTTLGGALQVDHGNRPATDQEPDNDTEDNETTERTGYAIDEQSWVKELAISFVHDDYGNVLGYANGPIKIPQEFIEEYERYIEERDRIQNRLKQYVEECSIECATEFLAKYVDAGTAKRIAQDYAGARDIAFLVGRQSSEIYYDVFKSRNRIPGSDADRNAAVMNRIKEWILEEFVDLGNV